MKSLKTEKRHIADAYFVEVERVNREKVRFVVTGGTTTGRRVEIKIDTNWSYWNCLVKKFAATWQIERANLISEIESVDKNIPLSLR